MTLIVTKNYKRKTQTHEKKKKLCLVIVLYLNNRLVQYVLITKWNKHLNGEDAVN